MTTTTQPPRPAAAPRRAYRDTTDVIVGGVASGLARHLGLPVTWVRAGFIFAALLGFSGVVLYAGLWLVLPADTRFETAAPGLESATRGGRRPGRIRRLQDLGPAIALAALGLGVVLILQAAFGGGAVFWPLFFGVLGLALLWRQADEAQRERWRDTTGRLGLARLIVGGGWAAWARIGAGLALLLGAAAVLVFGGGSMAAGAWRPFVVALVALAGVAVVVGPWLYRLAADLSAERTERIRTQERADLAAHLHDSVLQTLALIQKNAGDAGTVARLARAQERDLRAWLYADESADERTVASALRAAAADVEDGHGITVDVVTVGDCDLTEELRPVVAAAREAMTNAAKHAGTGRADVYVEITGAAVDVFVRDRGTGFDPSRVAEDRHGVRHSILDRMARHGGRAEVRSRVGEGTEVRLHLPRVNERNVDE